MAYRRIPRKRPLWYRKAGDQTNAFAQAHLGLMYEHGYGVSKDPVMACMWLNLAVSRATSLSMAVKLRNEVAAKMTPAQIAEAERWQSSGAQVNPFLPRPSMGANACFS